MNQVNETQIDLDEFDFVYKYIIKLRFEDEFQIQVLNENDSFPKKLQHFVVLVTSGQLGYQN